MPISLGIGLGITRGGAPIFDPLNYSPALWLDASDRSTLVMDGARTFASASSQYLSCASNSTLQTGNVDWWAAGWIYLDSSPSSSCPIVMKVGNSSPFSDWWIGVSSARVPQCAIYDGIGVASKTATTTAISLSTWAFIFGYFDTVNQTVNVSVNNGSFGSTSTSGFTPGTLVANNLQLGRYSTIYLSGRLDSVSFGKPATGWLASNATALRDYLYNSGSGRRSSDFLASAYYTGGNPSGAVSWWDMDARSGNETDRIGTNHLTDNGGVGYAAGVASGLVQYTGDPVKQWQDKSGNARHLVAAADSKRPSFSLSDSGVAFDGVDDVMSVATTILNGVSAYTIFEVLSFTGSAAVNYDALSTGSIIHRLSNSGTNYYAYPATSSVYGVAAHSGSAATIFSHIYDGSQPTNATKFVRRKNGTQQTLTFSGTVDAVTGAQTQLLLGGVSTLPGNPFLGTWYELLIFLSALNTAQVSNVERYLGAKRGITVP